MIKHFTFSISVTFISWIVGMIINAFLVKTFFYSEYLSNLNFIKSKKKNKYIGIGLIKWIIKNTPFKFFNPNLKMKSKVTIIELNDLRKEMTLAEINHLIAFIAVLIFAIINILKGLFALAFIMTVVNVLMNLYPSLLQQENKRRIDQLRRILLHNN